MATLDSLKTRTVEVDNALGGPPAPEGTRQRTAEDILAEETPVYESVGAAFASSGIITGAARLARDVARDRPEPEQGFDIGAYIQSDPDRAGTVQPYIDGASYDVLNRLIDSQSSAEADMELDRIRKAEERRQAAGANGLGVELLGSALGIGLDLAAVAATAPLTGGLSTAALGTRLAVGTGAVATRGIAAGRVAAIGGVEGVTERTTQSLTDPLIGTDDIALAGALGLGFGGFLGAVAPAALGNVHRKGLDLEEEITGGAGRRVEDIVAPQGDLSAAGVRADEPDAVPARGAGSLFARHLPRKAALYYFRNPKRVMIDIGAKARRQADSGLRGNQRAFNMMSRLARFTTLMESDLKGVARQDSAEDFLNKMHKIKEDRERQVRNQYLETIKAVFPDANSFLATNTTRFGLPAGATRIITQANVESLASKYSAAKAIGALDDFRLPDNLVQELSPTQRETLLAQVAKIADAEDEYYRQFGRLEVEHGLVPEDELIEGYRPQIWNRQAIDANKAGFRQALLEHFRTSPDEDWARAQGLLGEGEDLRSVARTDPERHEEIVGIWSREAKDEIIEERAAAVATLQRELQAQKADAVETIEADLTAKIGADTEILQTAKRTARDEAQPMSARSTAATEAARLERRINDNMRNLERARRASRSVDDLDKVLADLATPLVRRATADAAERVARAETRLAAAEVRATMSDDVDKMIDAIMSDRDAFSMIPEDIARTSSRTKRRTLFLGRAFVRGDFDEFLEGDLGQLRSGHMYSVAPQIALRQAFGNDFNPEAITRQIRAGYDEDLARIGDPAQRKEILKDRDFAVDTMRGLVKRIQDHGAGHGFGRSVTAPLSRITSLAMLGGVTLAQLGDTALAAFAGGRVRPIQRFWRSLQVRKALKEADAAGREDLAALIAGMDSLSMATFRARADLDPADLMIPGSKMHRINTMLDRAAVLQGWMNFMHVWNLGVRGGFGLDFMHTIGKDLGAYGALSTRMKAFYARLGIDEATGARIARELDEKNIVVKGVRLPDTRRWDPVLLDRYQTAVREAGNEALLEPGLFDTPFLSHYPVGRLVLQFQQFMFTAGERFIAPMIQEAIISNGTSIRPYAAALMGLMFGTLTDGLKHTVRGEGDEWLERWETSEGALENAKLGFLRSPLLAGPSATLTDIALQLSGLGESRFRNTTPGVPLAGPAANLVFGEGFTFAGNLVRGAKDGDSEKIGRAVDKGLSRLPGLNVWWVRGGLEMLNDN